MSATLTQVRQALATVLDTIDGLNVYAYRAATIVEPAVVVMPASGPFLDYGVTFEGNVDLRLTIGLFVSGASDESGTQNLDGYLADTGAQSIAATVGANNTLGGLVADVTVTAAQNHGSFTYGGTDYFGCEFAVEVML